MYEVDFTALPTILISTMSNRMNYSATMSNVKEMISRFKEARPTSRAARESLMRMGRAPTKMWWEKEVSGSASLKEVSTGRGTIVK